MDKALLLFVIKYHFLIIVKLTASLFKAKAHWNLHSVKSSDKR